MAAAKKTVSPEQLALQALAAWLAEPHPKPLAEIFKPKAAKPGEQAALANGWLEATGDFVETGKGKTKKRLELYRLSAPGIAAIVNQGDESQLLGTLMKALDALSAPSSGVDAEKERVLANVTRELNEQCAGLQHEIAQAVKSLHAQAESVTRQISAKLGEIRASLTGGADGTDALRKAITLLAAKMKPIDVDELARKMGANRLLTELGSPKSSPSDSVAWLDDVVRMVAEQKRQNAFAALTMKEVFDRLKAANPQLSLGQFHDGMRRLHKERRVRLAPYTLALATLPDPHVALYLDNEVKYYVEVAH